MGLAYYRRGARGRPNTMLLQLRQNSLVRQAFSYSLGTTLYKFHIVLLVPLFAWAFTAAEAGRLEIALFGAGLVSAVSAANLNTVVSQRYAQAEPHDRSVALGLGVVTAVVVALIGLGVALILSVWFTTAVPELEGRSALAVLALLGAVLNALVGNLCVFLSLKSAPRAFNVTYSTWALIVLLGTALYLLLIGPRADSFIIATLIAGVVCTVLALTYFHAELHHVARHPLRRDLVRSALSIDLRRAARLLPLIFFGWALLFLDRKLLSSAAGVEEVGVYGLAVRVANGVTLIFAPLQVAWWDAAMNQAPDESRVTLRRSIRAHGLLLLVCVAGAVLLGQGPLPSVLGDWFQPGIRYVPVLVVCATLISAYTMPYALLTRRGKYGAIILAYATAVTVDIAGNLLLDTRYGAAGAAFANLLAYITLNAVAVWPVRDEVLRSLGPNRVQTASAAIAGTALALVALIMPTMVLTGY